MIRRPVIGDLFAARFPTEVGAVISAAVRKVESGRLTGCAHLERDPVGVVCWQHPTTVRCRSCAGTHVGTHTDIEEHGCDICGQHMPEVASALLALIQPVEVDALVPIGRGRSAAVGQIVFVGWGACVECVDEVES